MLEVISNCLLSVRRVAYVDGDSFHHLIYSNYIYSMLIFKDSRKNSTILFKDLKIDRFSPDCDIRNVTIKSFIVFVCIFHVDILHRNIETIIIKVQSTTQADIF